VDTVVRSAVAGIPPRLRETLGSLRGTSRGIASAIMQLIPFEERPALEEAGILRKGPDVGAGYHAAEVTDFGWSVIDACGEEEVPG
jgi:hypothetical protein